MAITNDINVIYIKVLKEVQEFCFSVSGNIHSCCFKCLLLTSDTRNWILISHTSSCQMSFMLKFIKYNFRWWMDVSKLGVVPEPSLLQSQRKVLGNYKIQKYKGNEAGTSPCLLVGTNARPAAQTDTFGTFTKKIISVVTSCPLCSWAGCIFITRKCIPTKYSTPSLFFFFFLPVQSWNKPIVISEEKQKKVSSYGIKHVLHPLSGSFWNLLLLKGSVGLLKMTFCQKILSLLILMQLFLIDKLCLSSCSRKCRRKEILLKSKFFDSESVLKSNRTSKDVTYQKN